MNPEPPEDWLAKLVGHLEEKVRLWQRLALIAICGALSAVVIAGATGALAIRNASKIDKRERADATQARSDSRDLRAAAWRGCARSMLDRAEMYVSQKAAVDAPGIRELFSPSLIEEAQRRRLARLPILDCNPNLCGAQPTILPADAQKAFIHRYEHRALDPNPSPPPFFKCHGRDFRAD